MGEKCGISTVKIIAKRYQSRILMRIHLPERKTGNKSKACNVCQIERKPYTKPYAPPYGRDQTNEQRGKKNAAKCAQLGRKGKKEHTARRSGDAMHPTCRHMEKKGEWFAVVWTQTAPGACRRKTKTCNIKRKPAQKTLLTPSWFLGNRLETNRV